jgi:hypothetical protein
MRNTGCHSSINAYSLPMHWRTTFSLGIAIASIAVASAADTAKPAKTSTVTTRKPPAEPNRTRLEQKLKDSLSGCVFDGRWSPLKDGKLAEEYNDKYTIQGISKSGNDVWIVYANIEYAGTNLTVPIPVQVKWAGDTPVITLDRVTVPGLGTYSARVLIYEDTYAGTWSAGDHGGMVHGVIVRPSKTSEASK